jgi:hypothetical protein
MGNEAKTRNPFRSFYSMVILCFLALGIYFGLDYFFDLPPEGLEFQSEVVRAEPNDDSIAFTGEYQFVAHHARRRSYTLAFPIYERSGMPRPTDMHVSCEGTSVACKILSQGIEFKLPVHPGETTSVTMRFTIPAPERQAEYITRTANLWQKPISSARFEIPEGVRSNYHRPNETIAVFTAFRPKENWKLSWRKEL